MSIKNLKTCKMLCERQPTGLKLLVSVSLTYTIHRVNRVTYEYQKDAPNFAFESATTLI